MKYLYTCFLGAIFLILSQRGSCTDSTFLSGRNNFVGVYRYGNEILSIRQDNTFNLKRMPSKFNNDAVLAICYDTIAKGNWQLIKKGVLRLSNDSGFEKIYFNITQDRNFSDDSVYIKILLPKNDAFFEGRFQYQFFFSPGMGIYNTHKNYFVFPRNKFSPFGYPKSFFTIKDENPACMSGEKCYQRIYFKVFDDLRLGDSTANHITVSLTNFTECFVERMDMSDEVLLIDGSNIQWRGKVYKKAN